MGCGGAEGRCSYGGMEVITQVLSYARIELVTCETVFPCRSGADRADRVLVLHSCVGRCCSVPVIAPSTLSFRALGRLFWSRTCRTPQCSGPKLRVLTVASTTTAILCDSTVDTKVETAKRAINQ